MEILYKNANVQLYEEDGKFLLTDGTEVYTITSSPWEPCLYLTDSQGHVTTLHNSFEASWIASLAREGGTLHAITGRDYDIVGLCRLLLQAAGKVADASIDYLEKLDPEDLPKEEELMDGPDYCIPLKSQTLRERIVEMMEIAGDGPDRCANLNNIRRLYAKENVPILPEGEKFLRRYAYLFSSLSPGFEDENDCIYFYFETVDELYEEDRGPYLASVWRKASRVQEMAGCLVTPVGQYGFGKAPDVYVGENGLLYAYSGDSIRVYNTLVDLLCDELKDHPPIALDD